MFWDDLYLYQKMFCHQIFYKGSIDSYYYYYYYYLEFRGSSSAALLAILINFYGKIDSPSNHISLNTVIFG